MVKPDRVTLSKHAIERYIDRVKPHLDFDQARLEVHRLAEAAAEMPGPPAWHDDSHYPGGVYFELTPDVVMIAHRREWGLLAATIVIPGVLSDDVRRLRNSENATRRYRKRKDRQKGKTHRPDGRNARQGRPEAA